MRSCGFSIDIPCQPAMPRIWNAAVRARRISPIRPRRNVLPVFQSSDDVADTINVTGLLDRISPLPKIPRNLVEPIVWFEESLSDKGLNHRIAQNGPVRLPVNHFIGHHLITKLAQRFEAFGFRKRRSFLRSRIRRGLRWLFLAPYFRSRRLVRPECVSIGRLARGLSRIRCTHGLRSLRYNRVLGSIDGWFTP